ncbi:hypothetical protein C491_20157 [Natronococcus amylolyticus DSM 10524]|uniref:Uncharacterized protein n=1 Tax=Natronococcus amylolyticus DSM 10524 TaxID=1227497 RepID=L9WY89_9EURY|nr:hypothetical protein [Natronococcus amylolyticus]ELY54141.1 hypothetical protein C491_20157 [Natronococcus amylolyticus DSM 10524]
MPSPSIPPTSHHEPDTNHTERVEAGLHLARFLGAFGRYSYGWNAFYTAHEQRPEAENGPISERPLVSERATTFSGN